MSVLIKGMDEIPEDGAVLVVKHDNGKVYIKHACTYGYSMELVKIPEKHGRLIDVDELKADYGMKDDCADCDKELRNKSKSCEYDRIYAKMDFCEWLDDAAVVIEAEGAEE